MKVEIVEGEDGHTGRRDPVARAARRLARALGLRGASATVKLVPPEEMRRLNRDWRGKDAPTDVIAFPAAVPGRYLGDLAICPAEARARSGRRGVRLDGELERLALHGLLHLLGYDHERDDGEMRRLERGLLSGRRSRRAGR